MGEPNPAPSITRVPNPWALTPAAELHTASAEVAPESAAAAPAPAAGVFFKDLELQRVVGTGQFGLVRLVRHRATGQAYALKVRPAPAILLSQGPWTLNH